MASENEILERIYNEMLSSIRPAARRFSFTHLQPTADWAGTAKPHDVTSKTLKPGILFKLLVIFIFGGATVLVVKEMIVNPGEKLGLMIFITVLFGGFLLFALYQFFFNKRINYSILLNREGIEIAGDRYTWEQIGATGILSKGAAKNKMRFLVIAMSEQNTYKVYPLRLFVTFPPNGFPHKLAMYIEYFKNRR